MLVACFLITALSSCAGGVSVSEAKQTSNEFLTLAVKGDYAEAEKFIHPDYDIPEEKLREFFDGYFANFEIDTSEGYEVKRYTNLNISFYSSKVNGSQCTLKFDIEIDGRVISVTTQTVKNDLGYGIIFFNFSEPEQISTETDA